MKLATNSTSQNMPHMAHMSHCHRLAFAVAGAWSSPVEVSFALCLALVFWSGCIDSNSVSCGSMIYDDSMDVDDCVRKVAIFTRKKRFCHDSRHSSRTQLLPCNF